MSENILTAEHKKLIKQVNDLKRQKNAIILVHNYQRPEIYEVADFIGDSLMLCQEAMNTSAKLIVFCGVNFMAESAAILNPDKKVVIPYPDAGCAMADMINARRLREFKKQHPKAAVVCYINSSAEVKAESDIVCTSSNAVAVAKSLKEKDLIFVPDKNLATYVQSQLPGKKIIAWEGFCPIHHSLSKDYIIDIRKSHPRAKILAHPECRPEVLEMADHITSTSGMIAAAKNDSADEFFVLTECGMTERLNREVEGKKFYGFCNMCFDMKKNTLQSVLRSLNEEIHVVEVEARIAKKALKSFEKMFAIKS